MDNPRLRAIERVRKQRQAWRDLLLEGFETTPTKSVVRRSEVVAFMEKRLGRGGVTDWPFVHEVTKHAEAIGWRYIKPDGQHLFRGVKRRGETDEEALERSRWTRKPALGAQDARR